MYRFGIKLVAGVVFVLVGTILGFVQQAKHDFKTWREKRRKASAVDDLRG